MTNPDHLRVNVNALGDHIHQRLQDQGYAADEIDRAASGLIDGNRLQPSVNGEHVQGAWLYIEALAALGDARRALQRDELEAAQRHYAEAERNEIAAQREIAGERTSARNTSNASRARRQSLARIIDRLAKKPGSSGELWADLRGELDREGMEPRDSVTASHNEQYIYTDENGQQQTITKPRFATRLSDARKPGQ